MASIDTSERGYGLTLILCFFMGFLGVHRFYVGKMKTGLVMLLTLGGLGVWVIVDLVMIALGSFEDADGYKIKSRM